MLATRVFCSSTHGYRDAEFSDLSLGNPSLSKRVSLQWQALSSMSGSGGISGLKWRFVVQVSSIRTVGNLFSFCWGYMHGSAVAFLVHMGPHG
jgi:hypothetical protein